MDSFLYKIGLVSTAILGFKLFGMIFNFLYDAFIAPALHLQRVEWKNLGKWAVITGSTDGIGKAYAEALAKKGFSIVLISRSQAKLDSVAESINKTYHVEVKTIQADFTEPASIYTKIDKELANLEIGVLVNNVGMSFEYPAYFLDIPELTYRNFINCNIVSMTNMTKIVMPGMTDRKRGVIINVSSSSALVPCPMITVYAATKAFMRKFSSDLATEYQKHGLIIQCVCPGFVATNMSKMKATWRTPFPDTYVEGALKTVGIVDDTTGYFPHTLENAFVNILDNISTKLSRRIIYRVMLNMRENSMRRIGKR